MERHWWRDVKLVFVRGTPCGVRCQHGIKDVASVSSLMTALAHSISSLV